MDKDERLRVQAQAVEVRLTTGEQKAAVKMSDLSFNDMKVLCLLHNPEMPKTIESVLNRYSGNIKDKSKWVEKLKQGSRVASDITKHNIDGYNTFVIDASNIEFMQDWAQKQAEPANNDIEIFKAHLLPCMSNDKVEEIAKSLLTPNLRPKTINRIYNKYNVKGCLKDNGINLKTFCDIAIQLVHKVGARGWNYNNIKR